MGRLVKVFVLLLLIGVVVLYYMHFNISIPAGQSGGTTVTTLPHSTASYIPESPEAHTHIHLNGTHIVAVVTEKMYVPISPTELKMDFLIRDDKRHIEYDLGYRYFNGTITAYTMAQGPYWETHGTPVSNAILMEWLKTFVSPDGGYWIDAVSSPTYIITNPKEVFSNYSSFIYSLYSAIKWGHTFTAVPQPGVTLYMTFPGGQENSWTKTAYPHGYAVIETPVTVTFTDGSCTIPTGTYTANMIVYAVAPEYRVTTITYTTTLHRPG